MRVFVTGATGFVGHYLVAALLEAGHEVVALVRPGSEAKLGGLERRVAIAPGALADGRALEAGLGGCEALINLVGLIKEEPARGQTFEALHWEGTRRLVDAAGAAGVRRFVQMSANGARPDGTPYQTTKFRAEEVVRASGLDYTIFRPSVVFGDPHGRMNFVTELATPIQLAPVFPLFGAGDFPLQPVAVEDVASAFTRALTRPATVGKTYCMGGPEALSYKRVVETIATALGRTHLPMVSVPLPLVQLGVGVGEHLPGFPITHDQLAMLVEGNACSDMAWAADTGLEPRPFTAAALGYLRPRAAARPGAH